MKLTSSRTGISLENIESTELPILLHKIGTSEEVFVKTGNVHLTMKKGSNTHKANLSAT